jgi:RNA polymerase sigma-70 factor (ECF subfamily)
MEDLSDREQFEDAFRRLSPLALRVTLQVLKDPVAAEDVVQDLFLGLWRNPGAFDPARGSLRGYVLMLARSRALDRWRSQAAAESARASLAEEARLDGAGRVDGPEHEALGRERRRRLVSGVAKLPPAQRDALLLTFGKGLTARELAAGGDLPVGTAKSRVRLGLARMREQLGDAA